MDRLEWLETFELGITEVDDDHRELLAIMRRIKDAADQELFDECSALLDELIEFSVDHFKREEEMLAQAGYPNVKVHKEYHDRLLDRATSVKEVCKEIRTRDNLKDCCDEMFGFLVDDIIKGDLKFKSYLEEKGIIKQSED
ncbi:hemerythrin domain-containing protein [Sneathiella sp.]|uniref:bacteriohemerythrin n=1 Tax=Sneathiella sp. TaxID=1964365 RepID=UPI0025FBE102|nr:hemerythrin domain-containing protein [Sneathiella sp.]